MVHFGCDLALLRVFKPVMETQINVAWVELLEKLCSWLLLINIKHFCRLKASNWNIPSCPLINFWTPTQLWKCTENQLHHLHVWKNFVTGQEQDYESTAML